MFTLADATAGLPPGKTLLATIETDLGTMKCTLFGDKAPITVANFIGLSRGNRPFKGKAGWEKICAAMEKEFRAGLFEHGVIKGIQEVSRLLAQHFPAQGGGRNELPDAPVVI